SVAWLSLHGELSAAVSGPKPPGLLAALAHEPQQLAARLSVYSPRWKSQGENSDIRESDAHHAARRPLARCQLDLRDVGRDSRRRPRRRKIRHGRIRNSGFD